MPPSEQQQDGITDGEGTRIEATNSPSQNTGRLQASPQPTEASSHKAPPQAGAISLLLALFQWLHDQLRDQHISTQLFASQEGQYYQKNLHLKFSFIPPKSLEQMLFSTNKTNKEKKKSNFTGTEQSSLRASCPHADLWGTFKVLQMFLRPTLVEGVVLYFCQTLVSDSSTGTSCIMKPPGIIISVDSTIPCK